MSAQPPRNVKLPEELLPPVDLPPLLDHHTTAEGSATGAGTTSAAPASLVMIASTYFQDAGEEPTLVEHRQRRTLLTHEQPYQRRLLVEPGAWQPIDRGWIKAASLLIVRNLEGQSLRAVPTAEQQAQINERVVEIGVEVYTPDDPAQCAVVALLALVRPEMPCSFEPAYLPSVRWRCAGKEPVRVQITLFPL